MTRQSRNIETVALEVFFSAEPESVFTLIEK